MFGPERARLLEDSLWEPSHECLGYIEAWYAADEDADKLASPRRFRRGFLTDGEVDEWIHQKGRFAAPRDPPGKMTGDDLACIRLLLCERLGWQPLDFPMSQRSFIEMEKAFGLSQATLPLIFRNSGTEYYKLGFGRSHDKSRALSSVSIVIKLPQMFQLGNFGFSMTHSFVSGNTLAFLHGWNVFRDRNYVTEEPMVTHAERIYDILRSSVSLWKHPLLLPTILLQEHLFRSDEFTWRTLSRDLRKIERKLGVMKSGRLVHTRRVVPETVRELLADDELRLQITTDVNTALANTINLVNILKWDQRLGQFIQQVDRELREYYEGANIHFDVVKELESAIDHFSSEAITATEYVDAMKARLDIQLNVLYNFVSQAGNNLNFRIAAAAGLDSAAMKTLAFVTTVFLPPAFVASLFSMTMFDWQAASEGDSAGHEVVSHRFWIYWVVAIPLTAGILIAWRFWWKRQKAHYALRYLRSQQTRESEEHAREKEV